MITDRSANRLLAAVTTIWVVNFVLGVLKEEWDGAPINTIFTAVIGGLIALKAARRDDDDGRGGSGRDSQQEKVSE